MKLIKYNQPARPATFSNFVDRFFNDDWFDMPTRVFNNGNYGLPAVNIKEDEDRYTLEVVAPGRKREDFKVEVENDLLRISSEKKAATTEPDEADNYTRREFSYTSFARSFQLPETVDAANIAARYEDGVLYLELPKKEEAKPQPARTIEIS
jgi:HSP20 family protein